MKPGWRCGSEPQRQEAGWRLVLPKEVQPVTESQGSLTFSSSTVNVFILFVCYWFKHTVFVYTCELAQHQITFYEQLISEN